MNLGIRHLNYCLGDQQVWYRELPRVEERILELAIPDDEELWGWGFIHRSTANYRDHMFAAAERALAHASAENIRIDAIVACAPCRSSAEPYLEALRASLLVAAGVSEDRLELIEGYDCVSTIRAFEVARDLLKTDCVNVLVIVAEKIEEEHRRFYRFSLFSDFSLAMIVTGDLGVCSYAIDAIRVEADPNPREDTNGIFARSLERQCVARLLTDSSQSIRAVGKFMYLNLYEPIAQQKAMAIGFEYEQMFTSMTRKIGHCFGADPIISMDAYRTDGRPDDILLLCASGRDHAGACAVRRLESRAC
jgi:3-oxoacyl-[acyl-carrier-protein] synthase III